VFIFVRRRTENTKAICEKTAGLRSGNFSDLDSACSKMLVAVKIFQFHDMLNESERHRVTANGLLRLLCDYDLLFYSANLHLDMIKCALHQVLRLPNYILSLDYFIFTTIVILLS
jgi:hypothetical protein